MEGRRSEVTDVVARLAALETALEMGEPWLDPSLVGQARITLERSVKRIRLGADHTVVALVGATGSGKSSLFNALARMEIAPVGARRPLTSLPMACVWGEGGSEELLDWLQVPESLRITRESVLDADLQAPLYGLVLLDLPDHDSTEVVHRVEVDRLVTMVDLLVWVVDPQKYADHALHAGYLQRMVGHDGVMVVVLNQIDRLGAEEADACLHDLRRLLDGDGLGAVPLLPVSAKRGDGVDDLRSLLAEVAQDRTAVGERVGADVQVAIAAVAVGLAPIEPGDGGAPPGSERLVMELAAAAGVPVVVDAVAAEYRRRGWLRACWPMLPLLRRLRDRVRGRLEESDLELIKSGLTPVLAPALRPQVELAVETAVATSADTLPIRWADAVRDNVAASEGDLVGALDQSVAAVDLELSPPPWWRLATVVQYLLGFVAALGAVWLLLLGVAHLVNSDVVEPVPVLGAPLPLLLLVLSLLAGAGLAGLSSWALVVGARRRRLAAQERLNRAVQVVADEWVMTPIRAVLDQHRLTRLALGVRNSGVGIGASPVDSGRLPAPAGVMMADAVAEGAARGSEPVVGGRPGAGQVTADLGVSAGLESGATLGETPEEASRRLAV